MKFLTVVLSSIILFTSVLMAQEERKVLVEVFTNSHCPLCPAAHNVIDNYLVGPNGNKISYIYYHMVYPYSDDPLYWESMEGSDARDNYYNPVSATPQGWFDGNHQGSTSGWAASLNNLVATQSPLKIILSGTKNSTQFNLNAQLTRTGDITDNDLVIHFVIAEDLFYDGRNSVSNHKHVMRKMLPTPDGQSFSINLNETKDIPQIVNLDPLWDADSLNVVVFVQSTGSKTVYQSAS
ncbi:MAG: Omp28-related outer membrane protein, partial [Ignavibacteria bacterium]|nr:Omp28-related outer membrane protein [Ignavibacteria bacterium]